mgnify:CR=1 FL=1
MCGKNYILTVDVMTEEKSGTTYNYKMPKGYLNQQQVKEWTAWKAIKTDKLTKEEFKMICSVHADVFAHPYHEPCTCSPKRIKNWIAQIDKVYEDRNSN